MPITNAIGTGTVNVTYNAPVDERGVLGRHVRPGETMADVLRRLVAKGLEIENAALAAELKNIRRHYYGTMHAVLAVLSLSALFFGMSLRRPSRMTRNASFRIVRTIRTREKAV